MEVATRVPQASIRGNGVSFDQERLALEIKNLDFFYGNGFQGLKNVNLSIPEHKATAFIGPSGCGKSTLLRMLAGLENITGGEISIGGRVVNNVPPKDRDIAMVFQSYALYPHMTVADNMSSHCAWRAPTRRPATRR